MHLANTDTKADVFSTLCEAVKLALVMQRESHCVKSPGSKIVSRVAKPSLPVLRIS